MKKATNLILAVIAASLILVAGCYEGGNPQDPVIGYDGYVSAGWTCFDAGNYEDAMENFLAAIDIDVNRPEAYLGAGWCSILLPDYWGLGDQYDYMAVQQDGGSWPITVASGSQQQDLNWTVFECIDPQLTANDMLVIGSWGTTDTLIVIDGTDTTVVFEPSPEKPAMDNLEIGSYLYSHGGGGEGYGTTDFRYTFEIDDPGVTALFTVANGYSLTDAVVDSIVNGASVSTVYITVPYVRVEVGSDDYRTWCMYENNMSYEYASYTPAGGTGIANDAVAAYAVLQHGRGENGNLWEGVAACIGLADEAEYSFSHWPALTSLKLKGMAAAMAYYNTQFKYALWVCRSEGYGLDISTDDPDFEIELMQVIETMLQ